MLLKLMKYLKGYVKVKVEGYSPERFFNLCNANGILIWGIENKEYSYELYVSVKDYKKLRPFVRKTGTKIILLERHGLPFFLHKFRKRKMFFGGMILCASIIYLLSLFVWNIHFEGNVTQKTEELLICLEENGVGHGTLKSSIVCEEIERMLRDRYPNMLWVSAELRGTRIIIQIKENADKDIVSKIEAKDHEPSSIVADRDGIVESIIVRNGTALISAGMEVKAGQTLVEGYYEIKNDAGEIVRYEGVRADADIVLHSVEDYTDVFSKEYEIKRYTGRKKLGIFLKLFGKVYGYAPKIPYETWVTIEKTYEIHVTENFYLPFTVTFTRYLEYVTDTGQYDNQEIKKLADTRFYRKYENILQKGVQIIEKDVKININGKLCHVTGRVLLQIPVTGEAPAAIPELANNASLEGEN